MELNVTQLLTDLVFNILNIVILFLIVKSLVYKPVKDFLEKRKEKKEEEKRLIEKEKEEVSAEKEKYERFNASSKEKEEEILKNALLSANEKAEQILNDAKDEAKSIIEKAEIKAKKEKEEIISSANKEVALFSVGLSEKIIGREVNKEDNIRFVNDFLNNADFDGDKNE